ncbi:hypothetical protein [Desulfotignum phosphitoxidans]|nr:hypothetical protein [Desulfotignum phosphitoxidans]
MSETTGTDFGVSVASHCRTCPLINTLPMKESELCFVLSLKMCQTAHGLTDEMAESLSRLYFESRSALMTEGV